MANSLRAKLSKLRYDRHITDAEYQAFIKKLDGYEQEIRAKAIDEFAEALRLKCLDNVYREVGIHSIFKIAEQLKGGIE